MTSEINVGTLGEANPSTDTIRKNFDQAAAEITALQTFGGIGSSATVAALGTVQADAAAITTGLTLVSGADAIKGVKLPAAAARQVCFVKNGANAVLKIWPNTDDAINAIAANSAFSIAALTSVILVSYDATTWYSFPLVAS